MNEKDNVSESRFWKDQIKKHRIAFILLIIVGIGLIIDFVIVLIWYIESNPIGGFGEWTFNEWSLNDVVLFLIFFVLFQLLFVGVPAGLILGLGGYLWWNRLPLEEKQEYRSRQRVERKKGARRHGGNAGGILFFIAFCIYIFIDGNFNTKFGLLPYSYFIYSALYLIMWILIVLGIPAAIIIIIVYFKVWRKK